MLFHSSTEIEAFGTLSFCGFINDEEPDTGGAYTPFKGAFAISNPEGTNSVAATFGTNAFALMFICICDESEVSKSGWFQRREGDG